MLETRFYSNKTKILSIVTIVLTVGIATGVVSLDWSPWIFSVPVLLLILDLISTFSDVFY